MNSSEMSKYMNQLYNRNQNLQSKVKRQKTGLTSEPVDSCHNTLPKENNNELNPEGKFVKQRPVRIITLFCSLCRRQRSGGH